MREASGARALMSDYSSKMKEEEKKSLTGEKISQKLINFCVKRRLEQRTVSLTGILVVRVEPSEDSDLLVCFQ